MDFMLVVWLVVAFALSLLILKLLQKTFKLFVFLLIFAVIFGVLYFGYDTFLSRFREAGKQALDLKTTPAQSSGCSSDPDCAFVTSPSDCNLVANACNNIKDSSKFFKPGTNLKCSIDSVVLSSEVKCSCKKSASGSACERL